MKLNKDKIRKQVILSLPYVFIFWFCNKLGEAYRIAPGGDLGSKLLGVMTAAGTAFSSLAPSVNPQDLLVGVVGAVIFRAVVYVKGKNAKKWRKDIEYGSARWGTAKDIESFMDPKPENNIILTQTEGLTMNSRPKDPKTARNKNVLVVGGSGSGKTRFVLKPNLLQCQSEDYPTSFCVTDPKGQVLIECGKMLERYGYRIKVLNTINFKKSQHYNPLAYIRSEKDILKMVNVLISNTNGEKKGGDQFWENAERLLYSALIAYLYYEAPERERNFATLSEMINAMEVREEDEEFRNIVDLMFEALAEKNPDHFAARQYAKFKLSAGKTAKSILVSCGARLAPFDIAELRELMRYDELGLDRLGEEKTALFIITSDTDSTFDFVSALAISQMLNILCTKADDEHGGRLPVHVRFLLDEAANITIPDLQRSIAVLRSRECSMCLFIQAQSQLKHIYKDAAEIITANCDSALFLGGKEETTLKSWSTLLGRETVDMYNTSVTKGNQESHGQNFQKLGRELASIDELAKLRSAEL